MAGLPIGLMYLFVFTVFSKEVGHTGLFGIDYDFIGYNFCIFYLLFHINSLYVSRNINLFLSYLFVSSILSKLYLGLELPPLFKQFIPTAVIFLVTYDFFVRSRNYALLFKIYITISYYTALFGLLQLGVKFFFGINLLTNYYALFIDSIAYEPSHYAALILPACVYSIFNYKKDKLRATVILLAMFGTFSVTSYVVMAVAIALIFLNPVYLLIVVPLLYYLYFYVFLSFDKFAYRQSGFDIYFEHRNLMKVKSGTTLSFLSNAEVARYTITKSPLLGSGLGGHEEMYYKFYSTQAFRMHYLFGLNAPSAHSLIIRVFSELGLAGGIFYLWFLMRNLILRGERNHRMISIACLTHFLCKFLKLGGYFDYGTPFFAMMYIFNFHDYVKTKRRV
ncbi:MAG: hypothetical protein JNL51_15165 [Chitinophagaceae bacterium]|nr:hypothetical protein [Chitinophagaceae bacterium]